MILFFFSSVINTEIQLQKMIKFQSVQINFNVVMHVGKQNIINDLYVQYRIVLLYGEFRTDTGRPRQVVVE